MLSMFSCILLMYIRLISFIARNNILTEAQNEFRERRSTETAIHSFLKVYRSPLKKKSNSNWNIFWFN
jgi:hypothetical protein